jgi:hypothetical protein
MVPVVFVVRGRLRFGTECGVRVEYSGRGAMKAA